MLSLHIRVCRLFNHLSVSRLHKVDTDVCSIGENLEETIVALQINYPEICVEELRKTTKDLNHYSRYLVRG
jgi:hypothetical protein